MKSGVGKAVTSVVVEETRAGRRAASRDSMRMVVSTDRVSASDSYDVSFSSGSSAPEPAAGEVQDMLNPFKVIVMTGGKLTVLCSSSRGLGAGLSVHPTRVAATHNCLHAIICANNYEILP